MNRKRTAFGIPDMTCSGCVDRVQTVLERVDGVQSAEVDLEDKGATVTYDADTTSTEALVAAVEEAGYAPTPA